MNKSIRIPTSIGDTNITVNINQTFSELEILSMKIYQTEEYPIDISDFGVVIGRISCKNVGIPNIKVGIFIPLDETDSNDPLISSLYPFKDIADTDSKGNRYNLLPKYRTNPYWNIYSGNDVYEEGYGANPYGIGYKPEKAVGTIPTEEEICLNEAIEYIYKKYYKYTTVTNNSGDFMLMGVPVGSYTLHYDCDLTDIGQFSMKPIALTKFLGYPSDLFSNNGTKIRENATLADSRHIIYQNLQVNVIPFWGNKNGEITEIGITRNDITLNAEIVPTTTLFFSGITMPKDAYWYDWVIFRLKLAITYLGILPVPIPVLAGDFTSNPCSINGGRNNVDPFFIQFDDIVNPFRAVRDYFRFDLNPDDFRGERTDKLDLSRHRTLPFRNSILDYKNINDTRTLPISEYIEIMENGSCAYLIKCNRVKINTDSEGNTVVVDDDEEGLYTEFDGALITRMEGEIDSPTSKVLTDRVFMKIPQTTNYNDNPNEWLSKKFTFKANRYYSVVQKWWSKNNNDDDYSNVGMVTNLLDKDDDGTINTDFTNFKLDYPPQTEYFKNRNVHFCLNFLQYGYKSKTKRVLQSTITCEDIVGKANIRFNNNPIGGELTNTQHLAKGNNFRTNFIEVPKYDIMQMLNECKKSNYSLKLKGKYYTPTDTLENAPTNVLNNTLFFKGLKDSDCLYLLYKNNLL